MNHPHFEKGILPAIIHAPQGLPILTLKVVFVSGVQFFTKTHNKTYHFVTFFSIFLTFVTFLVFSWPFFEFFCHFFTLSTLRYCDEKSYQTRKYPGARMVYFQKFFTLLHISTYKFFPPANPTNFRPKCASSSNYRERLF